MFKLTTFVVLALAICVVADPIRQKSLRRGVLARQQVQPSPVPALIGYAAAGVTPKIPFELPTETEKPDFVSNQPDEIYGPPETDVQQSVDYEIQPDEVYGPPEAKVQDPEQIYGPPHADPEIIEDVDEENGAVISISSTFGKPARLVYQDFPPAPQVSRIVPARLTVVKPAKFFYTTRFQKI